MTREQAREAVRARTEEYLSVKGIQLNKPFRCLNPAHDDAHPSMRYDPNRKKVHCFACGADYDIFDLIGIDHGLSEPRDIFAKAYALFDIDTEGASIKVKKGAQERGGAEQAERDYTAYFAQCAAQIAQTDYLDRRGIDRQVAEHFGLGFDPKYRAAGVTWQALIIPTGKDCYIARNTDPDADKKNRYRKQGANLVYNSRVLWEAEKPVFIVEGELDALSILTVDGEAVALGSVANIRSFLAMVEARRPLQPLLLALDNDDSGQKAANQLAEGLQSLRIAFYRVSPYGEYKDANDALVADRGAFSALVREAEEVERQAQQAQREAYLRTCVADQLYGFMSGIAESVNTPSIQTGFQKVDAALDGGLYEGLYIMGAISSLGKTSFALQMADQIAQLAQDVLIFSLEMARAELMAKSISRWTLLDCLAGRGAVSNAKTARGITDGKRYQKYSQAEQQLIQRAVDAYGQYAGRLYIHEGVGDIGVDAIRVAVEQHIRFTGNRPVVLVDYLQILAPYNERLSDKQNTDKAVLELKRISRDHKIPVIVISSFNRQNYKETVTMEAFKESGAIEYSSDVLLGLQLEGAGKKDFDATEEKKKMPRQVELVVLKNRNGAVGQRIGMEYYPMFNYFRENEAHHI